MKITEIWFSGDQIFGRDEKGKVYSQSLLWYPRLKEASSEEREKFSFGFDGIHWRNLDEDISFESFEYEDAQPSAMQRFWPQISKRFATASIRIYTLFIAIYVSAR